METRGRMFRFLYNLLWPIGLLVFLPGYLVKMFRRGDYRAKFGQRLGWYDFELRRRLAQRRSTWLHAVSVGEVGIALKLAAEMRALQPDLQCILTTTTTTGFAFARRNAPSWIEVMYNPLDFWPIMRRAFSVLKPAKIVLVEAEIWPNLVAEAHARGIGIALANARLSPRSERRFRRFRRFVAPTFRLLDLICVQEPEDVDRWAALGVDRSRIHCTGSIKFDPGKLSLDPVLARNALSEFGIDASRPVLLGGSTHSGEEEILARAFLKLRSEFPSLFLFIAPRHTERAGEIRKKLGSLSLRVNLCSEVERDGDLHPDCVLLDRTGELQSWYAIATVVFVGKSLTAHGGQNPVEAIVAGKPVVFGPHMENFGALAAELVATGGAVQVENENAMERVVANLLRDSALRDRLVQNAARVIDSHRGATRRATELILGLKEVDPPQSSGNGE
jgi:3-deoxy-D-manno-octulosonic-acid transferase